MSRKVKENQELRVIPDLIREARRVTQLKHRNALAQGAFPTVPARFRGMLDVLEALLLAFEGKPERLVQMAEEKGANPNDIREVEPVASGSESRPGGVLPVVEGTALRTPGGEEKGNSAQTGTIPGGNTTTPSEGD